MGFLEQFHQNYTLGDTLSCSACFQPHGGVFVFLVQLGDAHLTELLDEILDFDPEDAIIILVGLKVLPEFVSPLEGIVRPIEVGLFAAPWLPWVEMDAKFTFRSCTIRSEMPSEPTTCYRSRMA